MHILLEMLLILNFIELDSVLFIYNAQYTIVTSVTKKDLPSMLLVIKAVGPVDKMGHCSMREASTWQAVVAVFLQFFSWGEEIEIYLHLFVLFDFLQK